MASSNPSTSTGTSANQGPYHNAWEYVKVACTEIGQEYGGRRAADAHNDLVRKLGKLTPLNQLVYQSSKRSFKLGKDNKSAAACNLKAALVQATGQCQQPQDACDKCAHGKGLWLGCVKAPAELDNAVPGGGCANCMYQNHTNGCVPFKLAKYSMAPPLAQASLPTASSSSSSGPVVSNVAVAELTTGTPSRDEDEPLMSGTEKSKAGDTRRKGKGKERAMGSPETPSRRHTSHRRLAGPR